MYKTKFILFSTALIFVLSSCDFGVDNPGPIQDNQLSNEDALQSLVVGIASDLSYGMAGGRGGEPGGVVYAGGILSRDIYDAGVFEAERLYHRGEVRNDLADDPWNRMHTAKFAANDAISRMEDVLGDEASQNPQYLRTHIWKGFVHRQMGENFCVAVLEDGEPQENTVHFEVAEQAFTKAIDLAESQGNPQAIAQDADLLEVAYAGRAQVRLALENFEGAMSDAGKVSDDHRFDAIFSSNSTRENNYLNYNTFRRSYFTAWGTFAEGQQINNSDPRVNWVDLEETGADGETPMLQQQKYTSIGDNIPLSKGEEMRLIEAEVMLHNGNISSAMEKINYVRELFNLSPKEADSMDEAWSILRQERNLTLWMEGRRLWDLRRFDDPFLQGRDSCIPPGQQEINTNPNIDS